MIKYEISRDVNSLMECNNVGAAMRNIWKIITEDY